MLQVILELLVYVSVGVVAMMLGSFVVDLAIPVEFPVEIKKNNKAVGWLVAGIYVGLGLIIRSAVITVHLSVEELSLFSGVMSTALYSLIGIVFFVIAYFVVDKVNYKYKFHEELRNHNEAVGIMIFGVFVGIALIVSGVIQ